MSAEFPFSINEHTENYIKLYDDVVNQKILDEKQIHTLFIYKSCFEILTKMIDNNEISLEISLKRLYFSLFIRSAEFLQDL
jgi:hypothetical protein